MYIISTIIAEIGTVHNIIIIILQEQQIMSTLVPTIQGWIIPLGKQGAWLIIADSYNSGIIVCDVSVVVHINRNPK